MKNYSLLIFDWDGTLADSTAHIVQAVQAAFMSVGLTQPSADEVRKIIGLNLTDAMAYLAPQITSEQTNALIAHYRHFYFAPSCKTQLFENAKSWLDFWQQKYVLAVATGKSRAGLTRSLSDTQTAHLFSATRTADDCPSKPNPTMVREICEELSIAPDKALMIGDTTFDLQAAFGAGVDSIGVTTGAMSFEELQRVPHRAIVKNLSELAQYLAD